MDSAQLRQQVTFLTDEIAKEERELQQLSQRVNELKRKLPENKRKLEAAKRDLLANEALQRRKQSMIDESRKE